MKKWAKAIGLGFILALFSLPSTAEVISGKSIYYTRLVQDVQVNPSGQIVIAPISGENLDENLLMTQLGPWDFEEVATTQTDQTLGAHGSKGDYLAFCNCQVTTSGANGTCGIEDGTNTSFDDINVVPASTALGIWPIRVEARATTTAGWEVTTGSAARMQCYGRFDTQDYK